MYNCKQTSIDSKQAFVQNNLLVVENYLSVYGIDAETDTRKYNSLELGLIEVRNSLQSFDKKIINEINSPSYADYEAGLITNIYP
jgi:hypothetical protein